MLHCCQGRDAEIAFKCSCSQDLKGVGLILCNQNFVSQKFCNTCVYLKKKKKRSTAKQALLAPVQVNQPKQWEAAQLIAWQEESTMQTPIANIEWIVVQRSILTKSKQHHWTLC